MQGIELVALANEPPLVGTPGDADVSEVLMAVVSRLPAARIRVEGGHYQLIRGPTEVSMTTWDVALDFYGRISRLLQNVILEILVNDIGLSAEQRQRARATYVIPGTYSQAMRERGISADRVEIRFEKNVKNRAAAFTKRPAFRNCAHKMADGCWAYDSYKLGSEVVLTNPSGVPRCTLLMGQMFFDIGQVYEATVNFYSTQVHLTMERAAVVAKEIYETECRIINFYLTARSRTIRGVYFH
jgi:hypothetical protein